MRRLDFQKCLQNEEIRPGVGEAMTTEEAVSQGCDLIGAKEEHDLRIGQQSTVSNAAQKLDMMRPRSVFWIQ